MPSRKQTSFGILAGGRSLRMGGADKAFLQVEAKPQLQRVLDAMVPAFEHTLVSYNGVPPGDPRWAGLRWVADLRDDFEGPLAGLEALLLQVETPWLLTLPVDMAWPTRRIAGTLLAGKGGRVIEDADGLQPLAALWPVERAREVVSAALDRGERAVHALLGPLAMERVSIAPQRIGNLNTVQDLQQLP